MLKNCYYVTGVADVYLQRLQSVQNESARLVSGARRHDHITPVFVSLHWLPIRQRIINKTAVLVWKCLHDVAPHYLADLCVCRPTPFMVASNSAFHRRLGVGLYWSRAPGLLPVSAALPSVDHEYETVCQLISKHQIRLCAPSSVISRPNCFSSSLHCCWQVGSAQFVRSRDDLASSAPT